VVDAAGLSTTCTVAFTVADSTSPVVQAPAELTRSVTANCQAAVPDLSLEIIASDNCTVSGDLNVVQTPAAGTLVDLGNHEVQVTVTDAAGNATSPAVALDAANRPTVAWHERAETQERGVGGRWTGSAWATLGDPQWHAAACRPTGPAVVPRDDPPRLADDEHRNRGIFFSWDRQPRRLDQACDGGSIIDPGGFNDLVAVGHHLRVVTHRCVRGQASR
jgi:hypothetical protein